MKLVLLGAPGAGKGTQAIKIADKYNLTHISTGDVFRKAISENTQTGILAKQYIDKGMLVPDNIVIDVVKQRLQRAEMQKGYILDGFPRTVLQAQELSTFVKLDAALNLDIDLELLMVRLCGRRVCGKCGRTFHIQSLNGMDTCECGGSLIQREDDMKETILRRLNVYEKQTQPLIDFYKKADLLLQVDGSQSVESVFKNICRVLDKL